jgi:hypothetical protein
MKLATLALSLAAALAFAPAALADCVDYSKAAHQKAQAELKKNLPTAAQLGLPSLDGFTIDAERTAGDPACGPKPPYKRFYYVVNQSPTEFFTRLHPNVRRRTAPSGGKEHFENPIKGDDFFLTSGTRVSFVFGRTDASMGTIFIEPTSPVGELTAESQPYSIQDLVSGTPWPGGPDGGRNWVPVAGYQGGGAAAAAAPAATSTSSDGSTQTSQTTQTPAGCPPASGNQTASSVGAEVGGAVLGGGFGRNLGGALGGALGGGKKKPAGCP